MKDFIKHIIASFLGFILAGMTFFILGITLLAGFLISSNSEVPVKDSSVLVLKLEGNLEEQVNENPLQELLGIENQSYGLDDVLTAIRDAQNDNRIKGIYLEPSYLECSFASIEEIRNALLKFKESGKFVISYADQYTQNMYFLASVSDELIINPLGTISWHGLSSQPIFYKEFLDKLGIEMQIFKVGTYKSAVEPFNSTQMSDASYEQTMANIQSIWNTIKCSISESRGITPEQLHAYADIPLDFQPATRYKELGIVDTIMYKSDVINYLKQLTGKLPFEELNQLALKDMIHIHKDSSSSGRNHTIAVYYAFGGIDDATSDGTGIKSQKVIKDLRKLREDHHVKAIVLRVNSPGGSAYGSEQIWHEVQKTKEVKPVIVSMGDYAASGGYYISCAADYIVANPTTLTGSIGIFGMIPNLQGLMKDKLGLHSDIVKTNSFADIGNLTRPFNSDEKEAFQNYINTGYQLFIQRCSEGRNMSREAMEKIAQGRVWTGEEALKIGLVDELGDLDKAIQIASERAGVNNCRIKSYPKKENFIFTLLNQEADHYILQQIFNSLGFSTKIPYINRLQEADPIQARLLFDPGIR